MGMASFADTSAFDTTAPRFLVIPNVFGMTEGGGKREGLFHRRFGHQLVLRTQVEIRGIVALVKLVRRIAHRAIDHPPAFHCRAPGNPTGKPSCRERGCE